MGFDIGGGGNAFPFDNIGDTVTGKILTLEEVQQTDMDTGEPAFWNDNPAQPKMMYRVTLQTEIRDDPSDDGKRSVYLRGSRKPESQSSLAAVLGAVKTVTGGTALDPGATLSLRYIGDGQQTKRGFNAPKLYAAQYQPAAMNIGEPPAPATPAPQALPQQSWGQQQAQAGPPPQWAQPYAQPAPASVQAGPYGEQQGGWAQQSVAQAQPTPAPAPAAAPPAAGGPTPEQVAALRAAGIDPASVFPGFTG